MRGGRLPSRGSDWYLPPAIYRATQYLALSYRELQEQYDDLTVIGSPVVDGMPRGSSTSDPTARAAERAVRIRDKIKRIEEAVREACPDDKTYRYVLIAVTQPVSHRILQERYGCPYGKNTISILKRRAYWILAQK